jgi:hypothetical protein
MKRLVLPLAAMLAAGAATSFAGEPPVAVDTRGMPQYLARQIQAEAARGIVPLRQYLARSYPVHQLRVDMVLAREEPARFATMKGHETPAPRPAAGRSVALRSASPDK